ncbi:hypothetical protein [Streptodolium elevatio]
MDEGIRGLTVADQRHQAAAALAAVGVDAGPAVLRELADASSPVPWYVAGRCWPSVWRVRHGLRGPRRRADTSCPIRPHVRLAAVSANGYAYGHNNPATYTDPSGLRDLDCTEIGVKCTYGPGVKTTIDTSGVPGRAIGGFPGVVQGNKPTGGTYTTPPASSTAGNKSGGKNPLQKTWDAGKKAASAGAKTVTNQVKLQVKTAVAATKADVAVKQWVEQHVTIGAQACLVIACAVVTVQGRHLIIGGGWNLPWQKGGGKGPTRAP